MSLQPHAPDAVAGAATLATVEVGTALTPKGDVWRRFRRNKLAVIGLAVIVVLILAALLAPLVTFFDPGKINASISRRPPSLKHWFGTDLLGRDMYTRVVYGARVSLRVGIIAVIIALSVGLVAGAAGRLLRRDG